MPRVIAESSAGNAQPPPSPLYLLAFVPSELESVVVEKASSGSARIIRRLLLLLIIIVGDHAVRVVLSFIIIWLLILPSDEAVSVVTAAHAIQNLVKWEFVAP